MSGYKDYEVSAEYQDDGSILLKQRYSGAEAADIIVLTPAQLVRLAEWAAKSWPTDGGSE